MAEIRLEHIKKVFDNNPRAVVDDFNLDVADGEFIVLVGPSGCGKSTTLRMIAGLEEITAGDLYIDGKRMNDIPPKGRELSMVFQNYALFPHMTVYDNMALALHLRKAPKDEIDAKVRQAAELLDISELLDRKPKELSGGQRQRVAIGRTIVHNPRIFLMDEPLSNLDAKLRTQMRTEIIKLRQSIHSTFIYVTHDQTEAMTLGDRIVVMNNGHIMQVGTPRELFDHPANIFVAGFIGTPQMNFFDAEISFSNGVYSASICGTELSIPISAPLLSQFSDRSDGFKLGIRPEYFDVSLTSGIPATVEVCELMGSTCQLTVELAGTNATVLIPSEDRASMGISTGSEIFLSPLADRILLFDSESGISVLDR